MSAESYVDRVIRLIRERIASGEWAPGTALPSHRLLAEEFGVGVTTIRTAVLMMKASGELDGQQGVAVYVSEPKV
jgi:GntR family transcriptional regulator